MLLRSRSKEMSGALCIPPVMCLRLLVHHLCKGRCSQPAVLGLQALLGHCLQKCSWICLHTNCTLCLGSTAGGSQSSHAAVTKSRVWPLLFSERKSCWNRSWRKHLKTQDAGKWNLINGSKLANLHSKLLLFCLLAWGNMSEQCLPSLSTGLAVLPIIYFYVISRWTCSSVTLNTGCFKCARDNFP